MKRNQCAFVTVNQRWKQKSHAILGNPVEIPHALSQESPRFPRKKKPRMLISELVKLDPNPSYEKTWSQAPWLKGQRERHLVFRCIRAVIDFCDCLWYMIIWWWCIGDFFCPFFDGSIYILQVYLACCSTEIGKGFFAYVVWLMKLSIHILYIVYGMLS